MNHDGMNMSMAGLSHETLNMIDMYQYGFSALTDLAILVAFSLHFLQWFRYPERRIAFAILVNMGIWMITALWNLAYSINSLCAYGKEGRFFEAEMVVFFEKKI